MTFGQRLDLAMELRKVDQSELARRLKISSQAVNQWVVGRTVPKGSRLADIARALDMTVGELLGEAVDEFPGDPDQPSPRTIQETAALRVMEYDVGAAAGHGMEPPELNGGNQTPVLAEWTMPADMIRAHTTPAARLCVVRVEGDSMEPDYLAGDRVLVDLSRTSPSPPGVFVLWDGIGLVLKRVELLMGSAPRKVRLSSVNPAYPPYELLADTLHISGRVIAKWMWR